MIATKTKNPIQIPIKANSFAVLIISFFSPVFYFIRLNMIIKPTNITPIRRVASIIIESAVITKVAIIILLAL